MNTETLSLLRASLRSFLFAFLSPVIPRLFLTAFVFSQPFLIDTTVTFVGLGDADSNYGKGLIGAWALVYVGIAVSTSIYQYQNLRFRTRLRGGLIALIYQRTLKIRAVDAGNITAVAVMGTDVERIVGAMRVFHDVWGSLLDIAVASWLLGRQLSLACLAPILLIVVFIGITSRVSLSSKTAQRRWIEKVQERLRVTTTVLDNVKAVRMLGLAQVMSSILQRLRVHEINTSKRFRKLLVTTLLLSLTPINLAPLITFALYAIISVFWKNETLLSAKAFTSIALISLLTTPAIVFIQILPSVIQSVACFDRIQEYCNYCPNIVVDKERFIKIDTQPELDVELASLRPTSGKNTLLQPRKPVISLQGENFGWDKESAVLTKLHVEIQRGAVTAVVGPVGSGKSAFISSLLGEMVSLSTASKGVSQSGYRIESAAYCSQQPWLEKGTVRQVIVGVSLLDQKWYHSVIAACGLQDDLKQLPKGDSTRVGSKGISRSGGQKQRIALARAVYSMQEIVILDDVFSGMDARTMNMVSTRLLGPQGLIRKDHRTIILATHNYKIMSLADLVISIDSGKIVSTGTPATIITDVDDISEPEFSGSSSDATINDGPDAILTVQSFDESFKLAESSEADIDSHLNDIRRKNGEMSVYRYYLINAGWKAVWFYVVSVITWIFCTEFSTVWVMWWSKANHEAPNKNLGMYLGIYAMLGVLGTFGAAIAAWFAFLPIISNTALNLHADLLRVIFRAPFRFFARTDNGELINRFSEDMQLIDMDLPMTMVNYTSTAVSVIAKVIILAALSQYLGATLPLWMTALHFLQVFYLQTSRQLRLLGIEARAPLYTHFSESVAGAATIRAFGWQLNYQDRSCNHIDTSQRPQYLLNCTQAWLAFVLNMMAAALAVLLVAIVVMLPHRYSAGSVGVSLVMVLGISETLARLIQSWTNLESSIGAVARIKRFTDETACEMMAGTSIPSEWPAAGGVEFKEVVVSYLESGQPVLKGISFSVRPREHIAICGRSGTGKTSLILSLLHMIDLQQGRIILDGVDVATVAPADLSSQINVVSQDPFLTPGTARFNVDPFIDASDPEIIHALERVGLWSMVEEQGGLDKEMNATAWSVGQKQLLCLARAIVRKSRVLVLDEPMSSVDSETETLMQDIIDSEFRDCTVLAIMHRLKHVSRYDKVALLGDGKLLEFGEPDALITGNTQFAELYKLDLT